MKVCRTCNIEKPLGNFRVDRIKAKTKSTKHDCCECEIKREEKNNKPSGQPKDLNTTLIYEAFSKIYLFYIGHLTGLALRVSGNTIELIFFNVQEMDNFKKHNRKFVGDFFKVYTGNKKIRTVIVVGSKDFKHGE